LLSSRLFFIKYFLAINFFFFAFHFSLAQELSSEEHQLYDHIMDYRKTMGLPSIPLSKSLIYVAQTHSRDLAENHTDMPGQCNLHSWSDKGKWNECCYTSDHTKATCMWDKPKEMTSYEHPGYEISCSGSSGLSPKEALDIWVSSNAHHEVIINKGIWSDSWNAIGLGMQDGYATVWFGHYSD
jgi:hypothetical protein